jgi:hypothetical protein
MVAGGTGLVWVGAGDAVDGDRVVVGDAARRPGLRVGVVLGALSGVAVLPPPLLVAGGVVTFPVLLLQPVVAAMSVNAARQASDQNHHLRKTAFELAGPEPGGPRREGTVPPPGSGEQRLAASGGHRSDPRELSLMATSPAVRIVIVGPELKTG